MKSELRLLQFRFGSDLLVLFEGSRATVTRSADRRAESGTVCIRCAIGTR